MGARGWWSHLRNPSLEAFDQQVLKTLFLIRYVDEITGNIDNLVTLFIDRIDANRLELRKKIEASLQRLEGQSLVNRNGEDYFFLTNEERDISREIKTVDLASGAGLSAALDQSRQFTHDTAPRDRGVRDRGQAFTVAVIASLRSDDKLTRTNFLRKLDEARKAALKDGGMRDEAAS